MTFFLNFLLYQLRRKLSEEERLSVGILPGLIRVSVGLEHKDDILEDILMALR